MVMTPEQGKALYIFLVGPQACDFQEDHTWRCDGTLKYTERWLQAHGLSKDVITWPACCDCEVIFNAPPDYIPKDDEDE